MSFFQSLYHSLYDVAWLASVRREFKRAWKFFFLAALLGSVVLGALVAALVFPTLRTLRTEAFSKLPDFKAEIASGTLRVTGVVQPLIHRMPEGPVLFVLDTVSSNTPTIESLVKDPKGEIIVISRERLEFFSESRNDRVNYDVKELGDGKITKDELVKKIGTLTSPVGSAVIILMAVVVSFVVLVVGHILSLLVAALIVYLIALVLKRPWGYDEIFTVGLFAPVVPYLLTIVLTLLGVGISHLYSLSLLAFLLSVIVTAKPLPPEPPITAENVSPKPQL